MLLGPLQDGADIKSQSGRQAKSPSGLKSHVSTTSRISADHYRLDRVWSALAERTDEHFLFRCLLAWSRRIGCGPRAARSFVRSQAGALQQRAEG